MTLSCDPSSGSVISPTAYPLSAQLPQRALPLTMRLLCFWVQNLTNEEQVVVIQARTVLTLAEKVRAAVQACWGRRGCQELGRGR